MIVILFISIADMPINGMSANYFLRCDGCDHLFVGKEGKDGNPIPDGVSDCPDCGGTTFSGQEL